MRIFFKDGSTVSEITKELNKYKSDTYLLTMTSSDAIYIASDFPLNHLFVKLGDVTNAENVAMSVHYWTSSGWTQSVNLNDYTDAFSESGFIEFTPDKDSPWLKETESTDVTGLESVTVYYQNWIRITFDGALTAAIEVDWIGNKFSDDYDLFAEFPIFNDSTFLTAYESGKTNWEEQHVKAAELIIQDLKRKNIIFGAGQILERDILTPAAVSKVAEIIYNAFGNDYREQRKDASLEYSKRIDLSKFVVDDNNNAIKEPVEVSQMQGWLSR